MLFPSIAANVKQVIMIAISTIMFATPISTLNGIGILVVLIGSARYSYVSVLEKRETAKTKDSSSLDKDTGHPRTKKADIEDGAGENDEEAMELISSKDDSSSPAVRKR